MQDDGESSSCPKPEGKYIPPFRKNRTKRKRISFGIILVRKNSKTGDYESILLKNRYSYEFADFVQGRYKGENKVKELLDAMTVDEKMLIHSLNFRVLWYKIWLSKDTTYYKKKKDYFYRNWIKNDGGKRLKKLVESARSDGIGIQWEFPKGGKESDEPSLNCAIREFEEETRIPKKKFKILPGLKRKISYTHMDVNYINIYYVAIATKKFEPKIYMSDINQICEVAKISWMNMENIRRIDKTGRLTQTIKPIFNYIKKYFCRNMI